MYETASFVLLIKFFALRNQFGAFLLEIVILKIFGKKMKKMKKIENFEKFEKI